MILLLLLAFLLDFYISFYFSFLNPSFVITVLTFLILKNKKKDLSTIFISLIIYDLLFSKTLFLNFVYRYYFYMKLLSILKGI